MRHLLIISLIIISLVIAGCGNDASQTDKLEAKPISQIQEENGMPVRVKEVKPTTLENWKTYSGDLEGAEQVIVKGMLGDNIQQINVKIGDRVEKDQVVAVYETDNPTANYRQAKIALENTEKLYNRMKAVFAEGGISQQDMDNIESQYKVAQENFNATEKLIRVKSPIKGIVVDVFVEPGEPVKSGDKICKIAQINKLRAKVYVDEIDMNEFHLGQTVQIKWNALPDEAFEGTIHKISISADPEKRGFMVEALINNENDKLRPGAFVNVAIQTINKQDVIIADRQVILRDGAEKFVFVAADNKALKRAVQTGQEAADDLEIVSGLTPGELLIIEGQSLLSDQQR